MKQSKAAKGFRNGSLPGNKAPLVMAYVPVQDSVIPSYDPGEALARGTLFPGLDLPFMNIVNESKEGDMLTELMSICFVTHELQLYLDTHADDTEAFEMFQTFLALSEEAHSRYVRLCGPVERQDMLGMETYTWLNEPWPWEYQRRRK